PMGRIVVGTALLALLLVPVNAHGQQKQLFQMPPSKPYGTYKGWYYHWHNPLGLTPVKMNGPFATEADAKKNAAAMRDLGMRIGSFYRVKKGHPIPSSVADMFQSYSDGTYYQKCKAAGGGGFFGNSGYRHFYLPCLPITWY